MADLLTVVVPQDQSAGFLEQIRDIQSVISTTVLADVSGQTHIIKMTLLNRGRDDVMALLDPHLRQGRIVQILTDQPESVIVPRCEKRIADDSSEASWEEMENDILKESNATMNALGISFAAGFLAVLGLSTNALHLVMAAMVIIPGFEPFLRIGLGIVARSAAWKRGLITALKIYLVLIAGAAAASLTLLALGHSLLGARSSYLSSFALIDYFSRISVPGLLTSLAASVAGVLIVAGRRSILTAGVMIALALVPSAALVGIGLVTLSPELILKGALRWSIDATLIVIVSMIILLHKRIRLHRRPMWL